ncbi:hypothetical protein [Streptomyces sp. NPDC003077]|uniref:hypothetical protein n=1 Tax=Streptomyces sp. NPDC003077 TaxID=3154443 RepID=UPI00339DC472
MLDTSALLIAAQQTSQNDGPGWLLRTVLIVGVLGAVFLAWVLLRGYGDGKDDGTSGASGSGSAGSSSAAGGASGNGGASAGGAGRRG